MSRFYFEEALGFLFAYVAGSPIARLFCPFVSLSAPSSPLPHCPPPPFALLSYSTEAAAAFSSGTSSTKDAEAPSIGPPPVSSSRRGAGGPSSRSVDTATAIELEFARLRRARSIQDARKAVGGFGEAAAASSSGTRSTKEAEVPSIGPPAVSSSRRGAGGPSSRNVDTAAAIEREFAMLRHARSMHDARNAIGGFGVGLGVGLGERGGQGGGTSALATSTTLRMVCDAYVLVPRSNCFFTP